jgi:hypothetical protein
MVEHITRLIIQEQKGIPAHGSMTRLKELVSMILDEERGSVRIPTQSINTYRTQQQDRQEDPDDLLIFEQPSVENWERLYAEGDHLGGD